MTVQIITRDITELPNLLPQQAGTATLLAGTGAAVVPISVLQEFAAAPGADASLVNFVEALLEEEFSYAMAILDEDDSGIKNNMWFKPVPGGVHGPRIKVAIDPPNAVREDGVMATVPFDLKKSAEGPISPALEKAVREFIELNRTVLLKYWNLGYPSTKKFLADVKPLPKHK